MNKEQAIQLANEYRSIRDFSDPEYAESVVIIRYGEVIGCNYFMRQANSTRTGTICVDKNNHVFIAVGEEDEWAKHWVVVN